MKTEGCSFRDPGRLKATGIVFFQILETLQDYRNLFVFFNTKNLKGSLKWLGEPEALVFTKSEIRPTRLETVRRGRPEWDDALRSKKYIYFLTLNLGRSPSLSLSSWHWIDDDCFGSCGAAFESPF